MNNLGEFPVNLTLDERLLERLSGLYPCVPQGCIDPMLEKKLLRGLRKRYSGKSGLRRFWRETQGGHWEPVLLLILFLLLGWALLRIIRLLLG